MDPKHLNEIKQGLGAGDIYLFSLEQHMEGVGAS